MELAETKREIRRMESDIAAQVRNLRQADETIRPYIQEDIENLNNEIAVKKKIEKKLEQKVASAEDVSDELKDIRNILINFKSMTEDSSYEERVKLVHSIVDRVMVMGYTPSREFSFVPNVTRR